MRSIKNKILVIENDQDILDLTEFLLQDVGYAVITSSTTKILDDVPEIKPDLILLDGWLSDTNVQERCRILKIKQASRHIPLILFSTSVQLEKNAKDTFADGYINKPFDIDYLQKMIGRFLQTDHKPLV